MIGLTKYGGYIPRLRLQRASMSEANGWIQPAVKKFAKGERSMCNWDEDSLTMAVEAARDCIGEGDRDRIRAVFLASTSLPFDDRQNAGIVAAALNLGEDLQTVDITSSQSAGVTALISALDAAKEGDASDILVLASDARRTRAGAQDEMLFGDGSAAFTIGSDRVIAEMLASHSTAVDFVDHYRGTGRAFDYNWEERWIRDEGYLKIMPKAIQQALDKAGIGAADVDTLVIPALIRGVPQKIGKLLGVSDDVLADPLDGSVGATGCAHPLVLLSHELEKAEPGRTIVVTSFGQGCDVLVLRTTDEITSAKPLRGVSGYIARRESEPNYNKFLAFNNLVEQEKGMRAELDNQTALTQLYRRRDMLTGLVGGECSVCGTRQFPRSRTCVNPNCHERDTQTPLAFADVPAKVMTWSADHLTYCPDPPLHYGMIQFEGGGRFLANISDADVGGVNVGQEVRMMFRIKDFDNTRGFRRYFWKATPNTAQ